MQFSLLPSVSIRAPSSRNSVKCSCDDCHVKYVVELIKAVALKLYEPCHLIL